MHQPTPIGSEAFRALPWVEQVKIVKLRITDPERYEKEVLMIVKQDPYLARLIEDLAFMVDAGARESPSDDGFPITIRPRWIACKCWLEESYYGKILQEYSIPYRFFINTTVIRLPVVSINSDDHNMRNVLDTLFSTSCASNYAMMLLKVRAYIDLVRNRTSIGYITQWKELWSVIFEAYAAYKSIRTLEELNGMYPTVSEAEGYTQQFVEGRLALEWGKKKRTDDMLHAYLLPKMMIDGNFNINDWHFLT